MNTIIGIKELTGVEDIYQHHYHRELPGLNSIAELINGEVDFFTVLHVTTIDKVLELLSKNTSIYYQVVQLSILLELNTPDINNSIIDEMYNTVVTISSDLTSYLQPDEVIQKLNLGINSDNLLNGYPSWYAVIIVAAYINLYK